MSTYYFLRRFIKNFVRRFTGLPVPPLALPPDIQAVPAISRWAQLYFFVNLDILDQLTDVNDKPYDSWICEIMLEEEFKFLSFNDYKNLIG